MAKDELLTDEQWARIEPLLPQPKRSPLGGRAPIPNRACFEGILWVLRSGARWKDLPRDRFPSPSTCWRRLQEWEELDVWLKAWRALLEELDDRGRLKWDETFADGSFAPAKKRGDKVGPTKRGKGTKWMVVVDGQGVPLGVLLESASPAEVKLIEPALDRIVLYRPRIERLVYDRAADCDWLRRNLADRGIDLICPHRKGRKSPSLQDGRKLKRYKRRWIVERTFAWIGNFRRLVVRWERKAQSYQAFLHIACMLITLRQL